MKRAFLVLLCTMAACTPASTPPTPAPAPVSSAASDSFSRFVDDYFDSQFAYRPSQGTEAGLHQYDTKLEDLSRARTEARNLELHSFLDRLGRLDRSKLSPDDLIDAAAIEGEIRSVLLDRETLRTWQTNPIGYAGLPGFAADGLIKRDFAPAAERLQSLVAREKLMPAIYATARENLANPPKEFTDLAIRVSKGSAGYFAGTVARWAKEAAGDDISLWKEFEQTNG
ncbi:MAG TPA: DUF885 family protein, partial [Thermoanaerobaculia bacterium]|nr:DUF885 family protein [Thermoanaerobaculia bacterium]